MRRSQQKTNVTAMAINDKGVIVTGGIDLELSKFLFRDYVSSNKKINPCPDSFVIM